jgi:hypothetical protein
MFDWFLTGQADVLFGGAFDRTYTRELETSDKYRTAALLPSHMSEVLPRSNLH